MALLSAEAIFGTSDLRTEKVKIKEWGGEIILQEMSVRKRAEFEKRVGENEGKPLETYQNVIIWLVVQSIVDDKGNRLLSDDDAEKFLDRNAKTIMDVYDKALSLNAIKEGEAEEDSKKS